MYFYKSLLFLAAIFIKDYPISVVSLWRIPSLTDDVGAVDQILSSPTRFQVTPLSSSQVVASWSSATGHETGPISYRLFYRRAGTGNTFQSSNVTNLLSTTLGGLLPETLYDVYVVAACERGTSAPSYIVQVTTEAVHDDSGVHSNFSLPGCCREQRISLLCERAMCGGGGSDVEVDRSRDDTDLSQCYVDIDKIFSCLSGMRNQTACCARYEVPVRCYPLCSGRISDLRLDQLDCFSYMTSIDQCFVSQRDNLPGHAQGFVLTSVTATNASFLWQAPAVNADKITSYIVQVKEYGKENFLQFETAELNYTLVQLRPSTLYEVTIISVGQPGYSLPCPSIVFHTYSVNTASNRSQGASSTSQVSRRMGIPSMPVDFSVIKTTEFTISLSWKPPRQNADRVTSYLILYRSEFDQNWTEVAVTEVEIILQNLAPDTVYNVQVKAVSSEGTSTPSPIYSPRTRQAVMNKNVSVNRDISGDKNYWPCCQRMNVPVHCQDFCQGHHVNIQDFQSLLCLTFTEQMLACFQTDDTLPEAPSHVYCTDIGTHSATFYFSGSSSNLSTTGSAGTRYRLFYTNIATGVDTVVQDVRSPYTLENLEPATRYEAYIIAVNMIGSSPPTLKITFNTLVDDSYEVQIVQTPDSYFIPIESTVTLRCQPYSIRHVMSAYWLHAGLRSAGDTLVIDSARASDSGRYTCVVMTADDGELHDSKETFLHVQFTPGVITDPSSSSTSQEQVAADRNETAHLHCTFYGHPDRVEWSKDGVVINISTGTDDAGRKYSVATYLLEDEGLIRAQLSIGAVVSADYGRYSCNGMNGYGSASENIWLTAPGITVDPESSETFAKGVANLTECCALKNVSSACMSACTFDIDLELVTAVECVSELPKYISCAADGRSHSGCCSDLDIPSTCQPYCSSVTPTDTNLHCLAYMTDIIRCMQHGHTHLPSRPRNVTSRLENGWIRVFWDTPAANPNLVGSYRINCTHELSTNFSISTVVNSSARTVLLTDIKAFSSYVISVVALNHYGSSQLSNVVKIETHELAPSPPLHLSVTLMGGVDVYVSWQRPEFNFEWITAYAVFYTLEGNSGSANEHPSIVNSIEVYGNSSEVLIENLGSHTQYVVYVIAKTLHCESERSIYMRLTTTSQVDVRQRRLGLGIGLLLFFIIMIISSLIIAFRRFRMRCCIRESFKETVSFENPGYTNIGEAQVRLPEFIRGTKTANEDYNQLEDSSLRPYNSFSSSSSSSSSSVMPGPLSSELDYCSTYPANNQSDQNISTERIGSNSSHVISCNASRQFGYSSAPRYNTTMQSSLSRTNEV